MFSQSSRKASARDPDHEYTQPLLSDSGGNGDVGGDSVVFSLSDDSDSEETPRQSSAENAGNRGTRGERSVRFEDNAHIITPVLRSTISSREAGTTPVPGTLNSKF